VNRLERIAEVRAAISDPERLRNEAERLVEAVPDDCQDVLTWSDEGYAVSLVASVLALDVGRELVVHRASMLAPLAPLLRAAVWSWVCAEELLGVGHTRAWAAHWAARRGGRPACASTAALAAIP
jgi:hypothetical protein